ncbi:MAG: hypothetical protein GY870_16080 [archaeon]|nr:hypothetical protein [archaeon]
MMSEDEMEINFYEKIGIPKFPYLLAVKDRKFAGLVDEPKIINEKGFEFYEEYIEKLNTMGYEIAEVDFFINEEFGSNDWCVAIDNPNKAEFKCNHCKNTKMIYIFRNFAGNTYCPHEFLDEIEKNLEKYNLFN